MAETTRIAAPIGILVGGIIGAGMFSLPFIAATSGLFVSLLYLIVAAGTYTLIHLMYADIILRTPGKHRFAGYVAQYLGPGAFWFSVLMVVIEMILVLTIYLILSQSFSALIIGSTSPLTSILIFWILGSVAIFFNIKRLALSEGLVTLAMMLIVGALYFYGLSHGQHNVPFIVSGSLGKLLLPLPIVLFAFSGRVAIPSVIEWFTNNHQGGKRRISKAIIIGTLIPVAVYALFILGVVALAPHISEDGISGLLEAVPDGLMLLIGVLGWLSLWSSYILVGLDIERTLKQDLNIPTIFRLIFVILAPLALYLLGIQSFLTLISLVGGVFLSLEGIFMLSIWGRLNKQLGQVDSLLPKVAIPALTAALLIIFFAALVALVIS